METVAFHCLKIKDGIIALVDLSSYKPDPEEIKEEDCSIKVAEFGLIIQIGKIKVPIPEDAIDYLLNNRILCIYHVGPDTYLSDPFLIIELPQEALTEAKVAYKLVKRNFNFQSESKKGEKDL